MTIYGPRGSFVEMKTALCEGEKLLHSIHSKRSGLNNRPVVWDEDRWGSVYITSERIIFESKPPQGKVIIDLLDVTGFDHTSDGWLTLGNLVILMDNGHRHSCLMVDPKPAEIKVKLEAILSDYNLHLPTIAKRYEKVYNYEKALEIWMKNGKPEEAARVRKLKANLAAPKTEIHGDYVDDRDTIVKDSVINRSSIGAGGDDKFARLEKLTEMKEKGLIDDDEFQQMKKEILGK